MDGIAIYWKGSGDKSTIGEEKRKIQNTRRYIVAAFAYYIIY